MLIFPLLPSSSAGSLRPPSSTMASSTSPPPCKTTRCSSATCSRAFISALSRAEVPVLIDLSPRSFCLSGLIALFGSLIWPENYDWAETRALHAHPEAVVEEVPATSEAKDLDLDDKEKSGVLAATPLEGRSAAPSLRGTGLDLDIEDPVPAPEDSPEHIAKTFRFASWVAVAAFTILMILCVFPALAGGPVETRRS